MYSSKSAVCELGCVVDRTAGLLEKKIAIWSSVFTRQCQAWIKCGKWRRVEDFCFIPYAHCCHYQSCWQSVATDSKEPAGHSLFLVANPFSLHFGIECHDSIGRSVLTTAQINAHMVSGVNVEGTEYSEKADFLQSHSSKWKWTGGELILPVIICGDEKNPCSVLISELTYAFVCVCVV